jgi:hypothetical protein
MNRWASNKTVHAGVFWAARCTCAQIIGSIFSIGAFNFFGLSGAMQPVVKVSLHVQQLWHEVCVCVTLGPKPGNTL